uniref:Uncharacterized protein n=1 Tax=Anopheles quadriannulatus TaxID=34691 RepID=A0A182XQP2_ANOQN
MEVCVHCSVEHARTRRKMR